MGTEQDRLEKLLTLATDPSAYPDEAAAAHRRAYAIVQRACRNWTQTHDHFQRTGAEIDKQAAIAAALEFRTMFDSLDKPDRRR
jgi:hypothetical protein